MFAALLIGTPIRGEFLRTFCRACAHKSARENSNVFGKDRQACACRQVYYVLHARSLSNAWCAPTAWIWYMDMRKRTYTSVYLWSCTQVGLRICSSEICLCVSVRSFYIIAIKVGSLKSAGWLVALPSPSTSTSQSSLPTMPSISCVHARVFVCVCVSTTADDGNNVYWQKESKITNVCAERESLSAPLRSHRNAANTSTNYSVCMD